MIFLALLLLTGSVIAQTNSISSSIVVLSPAEAGMARAQAYLTQRQYESALDEFALVFRSFPSDPRSELAVYQIGECYRLLNRAPDAIAAYAFFAKTYPTSPFLAQALFRQGELLVTANEFSKAIEPLEAIREKADPAFRPATHYLLALSYLRTNAFEKGRPLLDGLMELQPPSSYSGLAAFALADYYEKEKQPSEALRYWNKTLQLSETKSIQAQAAARGGWAALQAKNFKEAEALFETCRRLDAQSDWRKVANTGLLQIDFSQKRYDDVLMLYKTERQNFLESARAEIFYNVAQSNFALKHWDKAAELFDVFLKNFKTHEQAPTAAYARLLARFQLDPTNLAGDTAGFLGSWPQSPFAPKVQLMRAQDFTARGKFSEAVGMWEALATLNSPELPRDQILFEKARCLFETKQWIPAAEAFRSFIEAFPKSEQTLNARFQRARSFLNAGKNSPEAWEEVRQTSPEKSLERQTSLEQLGLLYAKASTKEKMISAFEELIKRFPQSPVRALASYQLGIAAMDSKQSLSAVTHFKNARQWDSKSWQIPATQRLVYLGYELKDADATGIYWEEYEKATEKTPTAPVLPAAIPYWLGKTAFDKQLYARAVPYFNQVNAHPDSDELRAPSWWLLAESQRHLSSWKSAIDAYERYRMLVPDKANTNEVLLALSQAHLGAHHEDVAQSLAEKVLLQDPEGNSGAQARFLLGEAHAGRKNYLEAAKTFATLSLLYDDPILTPKAMTRAAECYEKLGDTTSATEWREKLKNRHR